jgi:hypothetical protein
MRRKTLAALFALLCLTLLAGTVLVDSRCFIALLAAIGLFAITERGLPLPMPRQDESER